MNVPELSLVDELSDFGRKDSLGRRDVCHEMYIKEVKINSTKPTVIERGIFAHLITQ